MYLTNETSDVGSVLADSSFTGDCSIGENNLKRYEHEVENEMPLSRKYVFGAGDPQEPFGFVTLKIAGQLVKFDVLNAM